jgi:chromosome segregation ATPase
MDVQKLELLLKKISQAIKIIQQLKEKEGGYLSEIKALSDEIVLLKEENLSLKNENVQMKKEIQKNNLIHNELENKITEILKFLPEEEPDKEEQTSLADTNRVDENPALSKNISFEDEIHFENTDTPDEYESEAPSFQSVGKETNVINLCRNRRT